MSDDEPDEVQYGLVMPFTAVHSVGGPYDDEAFAAGWATGALDLLLKLLAELPVAEHVETVREPLVDQVDLIAMRHGWTTEVDPIPVDGFRHVKFTRSAEET